MKVSSIVAFLEDAYDVLNKKYFESALSKVAITVQSTPLANGHFTPWDSWDADGKKLKEINIGAEHLDRPIEDIIATLIHEMTHYYCYLKDIKDTSRGGVYHNKSFKEEAEKRGIVISYDKRIGWSPTTPSKELCEFVKSQNWSKSKMFRNGKVILVGDTEKKASSTRKYICPCCSMSVRATREVRIMCMDCDEQMIVPGE